EYDIQHMISTIADTAHVLARLRAAAGDHRAAITTATRGLLADPCSDLLFADAVAAAEAIGDHQEADRLLGRLDSALSQLEADDYSAARRITAQRRHPVGRTA
ncbi:MAG TPA: hypothetical protein VFE45_03750, partial [Coriobacteriia bacterium]|nr:hypothetical protein [Coriobacteriia bacterium]